jgi:hypothetical protein
MSQPDNEPGKQANKAPGGPPHPATMLARAAVEAAAVNAKEVCTQAGQLVNEFLAWQCRQKVNRLDHCSPDQAARCPCTGVSEQKPHCIEAPIPDLAPCISVSWGDSKCDCAETNDTEVLCITVCNCYSNVTFRNLSIALVWVTDPNNQAVPNNPDNTPSVQIHPLGPICFGDIGPCRDGRGTCVSREVVLLTRGAKAGGYKIHVLGVCFSACFDYMTSDCFRLDLCRD